MQGLTVLKFPRISEILRASSERLSGANGRAGQILVKTWATSLVIEPVHFYRAY